MFASSRNVAASTAELKEVASTTLAVTLAVTHRFQFNGSLCPEEYAQTDVRGCGALNLLGRMAPFRP